MYGVSNYPKSKASIFKPCPSKQPVTNSLHPRNEGFILNLDRNKQPPKIPHSALPSSARADSIKIPQPCRDNARYPLISYTPDRLYRGGSIARGTCRLRTVVNGETARSAALVDSLSLAARETS